MNFSAEFIRRPGASYTAWIAPRSTRLRTPFWLTFCRWVSDRAVYDHLPVAILDHIVNLPDFYGVLVADKWLGNTDYRQSVFVRVPGANSQLSFLAQMIDNGQMFDGGNWRFEDSPLRGPLVGGVYQHVHGIEDFEPWLTAVNTFPIAIFGEAFQQMPASWRCGDTEARFQILIEQLTRRRRCVQDLICSCHAEPANPFPNWP